MYLDTLSQLRSPRPTFKALNDASTSKRFSEGQSLPVAQFVKQPLAQGNRRTRTVSLRRPKKSTEASAAEKSY